MSQTRDQKRSTVSEVTADWHELMVIMKQPSIPNVIISTEPTCTVDNWSKVVGQTARVVWYREGLDFTLTHGRGHVVDIT